MKVELRNVNEIAFLRCSGFSISGDLRTEGGGHRDTVYFTLENTELDDAQGSELRSKFLNRQATVEPNTFAEMLRDTNDLLFAELRKERK